MERGEFLARLRPTSSHNVAHPIVEVDDVPPVRYGQDLSDPIAAFTRNATMQGATVQIVDSLEAFLSQATSGYKTAVVSSDPETDGVAAVLGSLGVDVVPFDGPQPDADVGVVGAAWGIAATGTVVFDSARAGGRSASLVPPTIVVLLRAGNVLTDSGELFRRMPERFEGGLPSQLVACTGPSKTGDIELELTTGVHGPGRVWIGVLAP